jgi:hypothetical protein
MDAVIFETWLYRAIIGVILVVLWYFLQSWGKNLMEELKGIRIAMTSLSQASALVEQDVIRLARDAEHMDSRVSEIDKRLRDVENTQARCRSCGA